MNLVRRGVKFLKKLGKAFFKCISPTYRAALRAESAAKTAVKRQNKEEYLFWLGQKKPGELMSETKKRIFADLPPAEGILRESQHIINLVLQEMDTVCRRENLPYWIMGGTLIGAIRHKGFIPWDGDADIGMMRCDYERLKEVLKDNPKIELVDYFNLNGYYRIPKLIIRDSAAMLAIDIVVFDYADSHGQSFAKIWKAQQKIRHQYIRRLKLFKLQNLQMTHTEVIEDPVQFKKATELTNHYVNKCHYNETDGDTVIWGVDNFTSKAPDPQRLYHKDGIFPLGELEFEGRMYYVPNDYMDMITREAGDIWSFPNDVGTPKQFPMQRFKNELAKCKTVMSETKEASSEE